MSDREFDKIFDEAMGTLLSEGKIFEMSSPSGKDRYVARKHVEFFIKKYGHLINWKSVKDQTNGQ